MRSWRIVAMSARSIHVASNQDKDPWCRVGEEYERAFVEIMRTQLRLPIHINPAKGIDKYAADLVYGDVFTPFPNVADLKTQTTPFFTADRYGMDPRFTVVLNRKDVERYDAYYDWSMSLFFWVDWHVTEMFKQRIPYFGGIFVCSLGDVMHMISNDAPEHVYQQRAEDGQGNARSSFLLSLGGMTNMASSTEPDWWGAVPKGIVER
jgi:hypothetical protein